MQNLRTPEESHAISRSAPGLHGAEEVSLLLLTHFLFSRSRASARARAELSSFLVLWRPWRPPAPPQHLVYGVAGSSALRTTHRWKSELMLSLEPPPLQEDKASEAPASYHGDRTSAFFVHCGCVCGRLFPSF